MTITVAKAVARALRLIQVGDAVQPVKPQDMASGIQALNAMVRRWEADGLALGWSPVTSPSQDVPAPDEAEEAIVYNLAIRLAPEFGVEPMPAVAGGANTFLKDLERDQAVATPIRPILSVPTPSAGFSSDGASSFYGPIVG